MIHTRSSPQKTPIALFVYNRPIHTRLLLSTLSRCYRLDECVLRVYCDAAKSSADAQHVAATRQVVNEWIARFGGEIIERDRNLGLGRSIATGVSELCDSYGRVIVLEDDLALSRLFLDYMLQALDRYSKEAKLYQISGYMAPVRHRRKPDGFFLPMMTTWGWATWSRAWQAFDWNAGGAYELLQDSKKRRRFDLNGTYPYSTMLESRLKGENDSWGILFWLSIFNADGLALHPRKSLVWNGGFDNSGVHCGDRLWSNHRFTSIVEDGGGPRPFSFPDEVAVDEAAFRRVTQFLKAEQSPGNLIERIRRRLVQRSRANELRRVHAHYRG